MDKTAKSKLLHQKSSKLCKGNLVAMMRDDSTWSSLDEEARVRLIALLPQPRPGEAPVDIETHPLRSSLRPYIETALQQWQKDLALGRETKKFRDYKITSTAADLPVESEDEEPQSEGSEYEMSGAKRKKG